MAATATTAPPSVHESLQALLAYTGEHPGIEVSSTGLALPAQYRAGFYDLVRTVRSALAAKCCDSQSFGQEAAQRLTAVRNELAARLNLEALVLPSALQEFCDDPAAAVTVSLSTRVLSYVQGSLSEEELVAEAERVVPQAYRRLSLAAYEAWLCYDLVALLEPEEAWVCDYTGGDTTDVLPAQRLELGYQQHSVVLRLPEAVFLCPSGVYALKCELTNEIDFYNQKPVRRRDFSSGGDSSGVIGRRFLLVYRCAEAHPQDAALVLANRDRGFLLHPHLMAGVLTPEDVGNMPLIQATLTRFALMQAKEKHLFVLDNALGEAQQLYVSYAHEETDTLPQLSNATFGLIEDELRACAQKLTQQARLS